MGPERYTEEPAPRDITFIDRSGEQYDPQTIATVIDRLDRLSSNASDVIHEVTVYSDVRERQLRVKLGATGTHARLHKVAREGSGLIREQGIGSPYGLSWHIDH